MKSEKLCLKHNEGAGAILPASNFYVVKNHQGKPSLAGYCKECSKQIAMAYHKQNPEKARAAVVASLERHPETKNKRYQSQIDWRPKDVAKNPTKWLSKHRKHGWKKHFGVTPEWYHKKLAEQGGTCAMSEHAVRCWAMDERRSLSRVNAVTGDTLQPLQ